MTKTAIATIKHMANYGGSIYFEWGDHVYYRDWGTLLKNGETKWHKRRITANTFKQLRRFLENLDHNPQYIEYGLNNLGYNYADGANHD